MGSAEAPCTESARASTFTAWKRAANYASAASTSRPLSARSPIPTATVAHAIVDAILGAIGEGDIGRHFPERRLLEG
jgi:hypothetical protein